MILAVDEAVSVEKAESYQLLPPLTDEAYQALKDDIRERGVLVPVEFDEDGHLLDGHHRLRAWRELRAAGIKVPPYERLVRGGLSEQEKRNHVRALNLLRRHLSKEQLHEQMRAMREDGAPLAEIAKATGVSIGTVHTVVGDELFNSEKLMGQDGKARPAHYKPRKPKTGYARNDREQEKVSQVVGRANGTVSDKTITAKEAREQDNHVAPPPAESSLVEVRTDEPGLLLYHGRFQEALADVPDHSVDLIFTDPPYVKDFLPQWSDLAALAARVLKPTGLLIAYTGQTYLPTVMHSLAEHLQYWWIGAVFHGGSSGMVLSDWPPRKVVNLWKPLLFYVPEGFEQGEVIHDAIQGAGSEKDSHGWQQGLSEAEFYISRLAPEGGLVLDPCLGGGTTGVAARRLGRRFVGCEVDPDALAQAQERIGRE